MISVSDALALVNDNVQVSAIIEVVLNDAYGLILAEDVISPIDMPPFRQASMDGYALILGHHKTYTLVGEVPAGSAADIKLNAGEAVRIFTGAKVPDAADTVIMQEHVSKTETGIHINKRPDQFANVRPAGQQIKYGEIALKRGVFLNAAALGFLAGLGLNSVKVYQPPRVSLLMTGDELVEPGQPLQGGQVYNSNAITLTLALKQLGIQDSRIEKIPDDQVATAEVIAKHLKQADVLIISGGISVGDYDFVRGALLENGVEEKFYTVNQKPGKPLWFGKKGKKTIFALPGNPASSLTCFYIYVLPVIRKAMGFEEISLKRKEAILVEDFTNTFKKDLFLKAEIKDEHAHILTGQASSMLKSFAVCNALVYIPAEREVCGAGQKISYLKLPDLA